MYLIRDVWRTLRDLVRFSIATNRIGLLLLVIATVLVAIASITITTVVPVAIYPLL